jgi:hypothetical protein
MHATLKDLNVGHSLRFECSLRTRYRKEMEAKLLKEDFIVPFDTRDIIAISIERKKFQAMIEMYKFIKINKIEL